MIRRHAVFIAIFVIVAATRFSLLFLSQTHTHSDEAIIGLMGKHILEGRHLPFYMYGQAYNAGAAWEAYLSAVAFAVFGVGVIPLKACIVFLSLICLFCFYRMCFLAYGQRTALFATAAFSLAPSLLKWHFQVRGYSWYFLSIPVLTILFFSIQTSLRPRRDLVFLFGLASGLSIWSLELAVPFVLALWLLLICNAKWSLRNVAVAAGGLAVGYGPVIAFNLTHHLSNWRMVAAYKAGGGLASVVHPSAYGAIFLHEMPKFFGPDTVLWYYPETPNSGYLFYGLALLAMIVAVWPFLKSPSKIARALRGELVETPEGRDFVMLVLTLACFIPYLAAPLETPGYFLGGCFFIAALTGRMLERSIFSSKMTLRIAGSAMFCAILLTGLAVAVGAGKRNQIETLISCESGKGFCMARIPAGDIEKVEWYLTQHGIDSVWTTISFVYPLIFESAEKVSASNAIFSSDREIYPSDIVLRNPSLNLRAAFVLERGSSFRPKVEAFCAKAGGADPLISEYGTLTVIQQNARSTSSP